MTTFIAKGLIAALAAFVPLQFAFAQSVFFHAEGPVGQRQLYYADTIVMDRTAPADVFMPDRANALRVADIRVSVDSNNLALSNMACSGLLEVPRN